MISIEDGVYNISELFTVTVNFSPDLQKTPIIFFFNKDIILFLFKQEMSYDTYAPLTYDPKINRGHLLVIINQHMKYEDCMMNGI